MDQQEFQTAVIGHFNTLEKRLDGMQVDIDSLKIDVADIRHELKSTNVRISTLEEHVSGLLSLMNTMHLQITELYQSRNLVKIRYGMEWMVASFVMAVIASGITLGFGRS